MATFLAVLGRRKGSSTRQFVHEHLWYPETKGYRTAVDEGLELVDKIRQLITAAVLLL